MAEKREKAEDLRALLAQLEENRARLDTYTAHAMKHAQALGEVWKNPAAGEAQGLVAGMMQRVRALSDGLERLSRRMQRSAEQIEQAPEEDEAGEVGGS